MPQNPNAVYDALLARRSGKAHALQAPAPDAATLNAIVTAASYAPDHGRMVPFRVIEVAQDARGRLAEMLGAASLELKPDLPAEEVDRARGKAFEGPMILALIARISTTHPKVPASDQWLSVGCALENLLLALQSFGFAAAVRSGPFMHTKAIREGFKLAESEQLASLIAIGSPGEWPPMRPKPALDQVFSKWEG